MRSRSPNSYGPQEDELIYVVLSRPKKRSWVSWLIRLLTKFPASHATIHLVGSGTFNGQRMVIEAASHGVGIVHPSTWDANNQVVKVYQMVDGIEHGREALAYVWSYLGTSYDIYGLVHFAGRLILKRLFGIRTSAPTSEDKWFCTELVVRWLAHVSRLRNLEPPNILPDETAPSDLALLLLNTGLFKEIPCESLSSVTST